MDSFFSARWRSAAQAWLDARWWRSGNSRRWSRGCTAIMRSTPDSTRRCPLDSPGETLTPAQRQTDEALPRAILSLFRAIGGHVLGAAPAGRGGRGRWCSGCNRCDRFDTATRRRDCVLPCGCNRRRTALQRMAPHPFAASAACPRRFVELAAASQQGPMIPIPPIPSSTLRPPSPLPTTSPPPTLRPTPPPQPPPPASRTLLSLLLACRPLPASAASTSPAPAPAPILALLPATCTSLRAVAARPSPLTVVTAASRVASELKLLALGGCGGIDDTALRAYLSALARQICHEITQQPSSSVFSGGDTLGAAEPVLLPDEADTALWIVAASGSRAGHRASAHAFGASRAGCAD